jgi:subtilase family serine protease
VLGVTGLSAPQQMTADNAGIESKPPYGFRNARPCSLSYGQIAAKYEADGKTALPQFEGKTLKYAPCGYVPSQYRSAYGVTSTGLTGAGVTVAITDAYASSTMPKDANIYATQHGDAAFTDGQYTESYPALPMRKQQVCGPSGWSGEQTLDIEAVHGIAPEAGVKYYAARSCYDNDLLDAINRAIDDNVASYITNSWGEPSSDETAGTIHAYEQAFLQAGMQGIGVLFSSGDSGDDLAATGLKQTDYPTSDPWVTAVGGTSDAIGHDGTMIGQAGWGTEKYVLSKSGKSWEAAADNPFLYGAGGGFSTLFNRPDYQQGVIPAGSPAGRAVPDIAMDADPTVGMLVGQTQLFPDGRAYGEFRIGGTSLASPLMAGMQALANQAAGERLGFANPRIYELARDGAAAFRDVTHFRQTGNVRPDFVNGLDATEGIVYSVRTFGQDASLKTARGWDPVTGVGSPTAAYLMGNIR